MTISAQMIPPEQATSKPDNSEIRSLISRVQHLKQSADSWNTAYLRLVFVAVLVAAATFSVQYFASRKGKQYSDAQAQLIREKDRQLSEDLASKDLQIKEAQARSSAAAERAAQANSRAVQLEAEAEYARAKQKELETEALRAREAIAEANSRAAIANEKAEAARLEQEKLRRDNLELEAALQPRKIVWTSATIPSLREFAGTLVRSQVAPDYEARQFAAQLIGLLRKAAWNIEIVGDDPNRGMNIASIPPGVYIFTCHGFDPLNPDPVLSRSMAAANALKRVLEWEPPAAVPTFLHNKIEVSLHPSGVMHIRRDEVVVLIGLKSADHLVRKRMLEDWEKQVREYEAARATRKTKE